MKLMNFCTFDLSEYALSHNAYWCEIDDAIAEPVSLLNKKGYRTAFCCSGHADSGHNPEVAYIQFEFGGITPETLPDGWYWESDGQMEYVYDTADPKELEKTIIKVMKNLLIWANDLPKTNSLKGIDLMVQKVKNIYDERIVGR